MMVSDSTAFRFGQVAEQTDGAGTILATFTCDPNGSRTCMTTR